MIVDLPKGFQDDRGSIQILIDHQIGGVQVIASKKGTVRANHYHKEDDHFCYLQSGKIEYYYRPAKSQEPPKMITIQPGQMFYTPPLVEHAMKFTEDSVFFVFSTFHRDSASYEADLVRVKLI